MDFAGTDGIDPDLVGCIVAGEVLVKAATAVLPFVGDVVRRWDVALGPLRAAE